MNCELAAAYRAVAKITDLFYYNEQVNRARLQDDSTRSIAAHPIITVM